MSKMQEAFEKWFLSLGYQQLPSSKTSFEAGYQAVLAAVKEGGEVAWQSSERPYPLKYIKESSNWTPLYKLPEDV